VLITTGSNSPLHPDKYGPIDCIESAVTRKRNSTDKYCSCSAASQLANIDCAADMGIEGYATKACRAASSNRTSAAALSPWVVSSEKMRGRAVSR
jgi:hypothetical protein